VPAATLQFLESFDSIRTSRLVASEQAATESLQAFADVLATLALGREFVVPQSYAFDSPGFVNVAEALITAHGDAFRGKGRPEPLPLRLHLFHQPSFRAAAARMLRRMDEPEGLFVSSLLPYAPAHAVERRASAAADQVEAGIYTGLIELVPWELQSKFRTVWSVLSEAGPDDPIVLQAAYGGFVDLPDGMVALAGRDSDIRRVLAAEGFENRADFVALTAGVERLVAAGGREGFKNRSFIYSDKPWPGDKDRRTVLQIVGDAETLCMVQECVTTLYNARLAASAGVSSSVYSTNVMAFGASLDHAALAQEVALAFYEVTRRARLGLPMDADLRDAEVAADERPPTFDLVVHNGVGAAPAQVIDTFERLQDKIRQAFEELLRLRLQRDFIRSAGLLDVALAGGDPGYERLLEKHTRLVAKTLAGVLSVDTGSGWFRLAAAATSAGLAGMITQNVYVAGAAAAFSATVPEYLQIAQKTRPGTRDRIARAMAHLIRVGQVHPGATDGFPASGSPPSPIGADPTRPQAHP
jgi:hypothetical protein